MKKVIYCVALLSLIGAAFLAGSLYSESADAQKKTSGRKVLYYVDPMHSAYKSDKPGIAPDCGMQLEPVYADSAPASGMDHDLSSQPPGTIRISAEKQQSIGVRVTTVEKAAGTRSIRLLGRVAPDEAKVYKLIAGADGFIRETSAATTGSQVKKDEWLATFSSPELRAPIQAYLVALETAERQKQAAAQAPIQLKAINENLQLARDRVLSLGMSGIQVEEIARTREVPSDIKIFAPAAGFVFARNASPGQRFQKGSEWYRIADLSRVWIQADAFQKDSQYIHPGQTAHVTLSADGQTFTARISELLPQFDVNSRTLKVRLEVDNPAYALRPDMFADVEVPVSLPPAITVPVDAILDTGLNKTVFVDRGQGFFEPRPVETGWRFGDRIEIVKGLEAGERIVTSGNFLLDSESRMKQAAAATQGQMAKDPSCGMDVNPATAKAHGQYGGKQYYFCSKQCQQKFEKTHLPEAAGSAGSARGKQS